jgi:glycine/D-amino acid oxidase-like deaminating enzyme
MRRAGPIDLDVVIFGGGSAGLWLLDELVRHDLDAVLLEKDDLGRGQTIASQGIIHGGLKYSLRGFVSPSARQIRDMPLIWRRCLAGEGVPDLRGTRLRGDYCHLWRCGSITSRLSMLGARAGLRVAPVSLDHESRPEVLRRCPGVVARLDEQVVEPASVLAVLAALHPDRIFQIDTASGLELDAAGPGCVELIRLINPHTGEPANLRPRFVVLTAGVGNAALRQTAGLSAAAMQRRPLHMAVARGELPWLNGHCIDAAATRVTITSTRDFANRVVWQIGGQLAEEGVLSTPRAMMARAREELEEVIPGLSLDGASWTTYRVDRAEAAAGLGRRPDDVWAGREGNVITAWPTKLALVPHLATRIVAQIRSGPGHGSDRPQDAGWEPGDWPRPAIAAPPWEEHEQWSSDV